MRITYYLMGNTCPLNCDFCFWEKRYKDVPFKIKKHIINEIVKAGYKGIVISGGDPAYSKNFLKILKYAKSKGLFIRVDTTGLNITQNKAKQMSKYIDIISLTLDGSSKEKTSIMRKNKEIFNKTLSLLQVFNDLKTKIDVKTLVTKLNYSDIENIGTILENYKINEWALFEFVPINRAKHYKNKFFILHEHYNSLILKIKKMFPSLKIGVYKAKEMPEDSCFINSLGEIHTYKRGCGDIRIGDLKKTGLKIILQKNNL